MTTNIDIIPIPEEDGTYWDANQYGHAVLNTCHNYTLETLLEYGDAREAATRVAMEQELEALRADADRYRWLRTQIERQRFVIAKSCAWDGLKSWSGDSPDKHIDAAREAK